MSTPRDEVYRALSYGMITYEQFAEQMAILNEAEEIKKGVA